MTGLRYHPGIAQEPDDCPSGFFFAPRPLRRTTIKIGLGCPYLPQGVPSPKDGFFSWNLFEGKAGMKTRLKKVLRSALPLLVVFLFLLSTRAATPVPAERHLLYVATPGIRNDLKFGGAGILVFDMDHGHQFLRRIATPASQIPKPENIKGVCAHAATRKLFFSTPTTLYCLDLQTEKTLWKKTLPGGCRSAWR